MSPKELLREEIDQLDETAAARVLDFVKHLSKSKAAGFRPSLMSRLKKMSIDAPEDFSSNLDLYLSGEGRRRRRKSSGRRAPFVDLR